jgi:hypothetical protein
MSMTFIFSQTVSAEIYKWTDADGKIHYGDKPRDPAQAREAQQVELEESYQPAERTAQEQQAYDEEQRLISLRDQMRRREEQQAQEEASAKKVQAQEALCAKYEEAVEKLSAMVVENDVRTITYVKGEDGRPVSAERQREIVDELRAKMADAGCP